MSDSRRWYLDTSVLLRAMLGDSPSALAWLNKAFTAGDEFYSSHLLETETMRTIHNSHLAAGGVDYPDWSIPRMWLDRINRVHITQAILADAILLAASIRTLDAIHLATADALGSSVGVVTHDARMAEAIRTLNAHPVHPRRLRVYDPVDDDPTHPPVGPTPQ